MKLVSVFLFFALVALGGIHAQYNNNKCIGFIAFALLILFWRIYKLDKKRVR